MDREPFQATSRTSQPHRERKNSNNDATSRFMADPWDRQNPPRLVGYESWLYQMPCIDSSGDLFVSGHGSGLWITQSSCSEPQAATETVAKSLFLIKSNDGQPVPDDLVAHTLLELERRFGGRVVRDADDPRPLAARRRVVPR